MDFFLSSHHEDYNIAGKVKLELESRGSTAFIAHKDIEISKAWREEILSNLSNCQALIAVVTPNFAHSAYANQEAGIILEKRKPVISLKFTKELPGFLESIQAVPASDATIAEAVEKAIKVIEVMKPTVYIPLPLKKTEEIENIAIEEMIRHIKRQDRVQVEKRDITISQVKLENNSRKLGVFFGLAGTAEPKYSWGYNWNMDIDARTGRILNIAIRVFL